MTHSAQQTLLKVNIKKKKKIQMDAVQTYFLPLRQLVHEAHEQVCVTSTQLVSSVCIFAQ